LSRRGGQEDERTDPRKKIEGQRMKLERLGEWLRKISRGKTLDGAKKDAVREKGDSTRGKHFIRPRPLLCKRGVAKQGKNLQKKNNAPGEPGKNDRKNNHADSGKGIKKGTSDEVRRRKSLRVKKKTPEVGEKVHKKREEGLRDRTKTEGEGKKIGKRPNPSRERDLSKRKFQ